MLMLDRLGRKMFGEDLDAIRENFQIVNVTNIEQYRNNLWPHEENELIHTSYEKDFPTVVSPWPRVWLEYNSLYLDSVDSVGVLIQCEEIPPDKRSWEADPIVEWAGGTPGKALGADGPRPDAMPRWMMQYEIWTSVGRDSLIPFGLWQYLDDDGKIIVGPGAARSMGIPQSGDATNEQVLNVLLYPVWLALAFTHCKNVAIAEHKTPEKVAKKRRKLGREPGTTHKTLVIDPMKQILAGEGNAHKTGIRQALHICRGHFVTYTPEKPLFGKYSGTFWKPMHLRGSKERGEIKKQYQILPEDK